MKSQKIVHLSSVHPPGDARITVKECASLISAGFDVVFICPGVRDSVIAGVTVRVVRLRSGRLARALLSSLDVFRAARKEKGDAYHLHDPELLLVGVVLRMLGSIVVYDAHEEFPKTIRSKHWIPAPLRLPVAFIFGILEWSAARAISGVVVATPPIARRFPPSRTVVVQNFAMPDELTTSSPIPYSERPANFVYIGGIAEVRGAREMVSAIGRVPDHFGAMLTIAGPATHDELLAEMRADSGWARVRHFSWRSRQEVAELLGEARAGMLLLHPITNYVESYPVKLFEYMAAGIPVILSDFRFWKEMLHGVDCGIFVNPHDPEAVASAMSWILANPLDAEKMGARGRAAVEERFNWTSESKKLSAFYRKLFSSSSPAKTTRTTAIHA